MLFFYVDESQPFPFVLFVLFAVFVDLFCNKLIFFKVQATDDLSLVKAYRLNLKVRIFIESIDNDRILNFFFFGQEVPNSG